MPQTDSAIGKIGIIGLGLMGGSMALAARKFHPRVRIVACDRNPDIGAQALKLGMIDHFLPLEELDGGEADLIFVATPVSSIAAIVRQLLDQDRPPAIITDMGSTKAGIVEEVGPAENSSACYIGGHPMCGSELEGLEGADPFLFENAIYILASTAGVDPEKQRVLRDFVGAVGAMVVEMEPDRHDSIVAHTSHLPYLAATMLVDTFVSQFEGDRRAHTMAAGGFYDTTRVASCPPEMWREICLGNRKHLRIAVDRLVDKLQELGAAIERGDGDELHRAFERARRLRSSLPPYRKGLLPNAYELVIKAQDRPGFIAEVAGVLGAWRINIRDIEVLHVREGEGGTLLVSVSSEEEVGRSLTALEGAGFVARRR